MTRPMSLQHHHVRVYQSLRTAHLERAHALPAASIVYRNRNYDFSPPLLEGLDLVHSPGVGVLVRTLLASSVAVLEVNEPLARVAIKYTASAVMAVRARDRIRGERTRVVTYAIENRYPFTDSDNRQRGGLLRTRVEVALTRYVARNLDRIAFGTEAALRNYSEAPGLATRGAIRLVPAIPSRCSCLTPSTGMPRPEEVVFLGRLDSRKGVRELMASWPLVVSARPESSLTILGQGPLEAEVESFAGAHPTVKFIRDPSREAIHAQLRSCAVVVLLSQPAKHWREQVGLPIVEGLAHGCTVVTSTETGLADWLGAHGHVLVGRTATAGQVAEAIESAMARRLGREDVLASLPTIDGRLAADMWLFEREDRH